MARLDHEDALASARLDCQALSTARMAVQAELLQVLAVSDQLRDRLAETQLALDAAHRELRRSSLHAPQRPAEAHAIPDTSSVAPAPREAVQSHHVVPLASTQPSRDLPAPLAVQPAPMRASTSAVPFTAVRNSSAASETPWRISGEVTALITPLSSPHAAALFASDPPAAAPPPLDTGQGWPLHAAAGSLLRASATSRRRSLAEELLLDNDDDEVQDLNGHNNRGDSQPPFVGLSLTPTAALGVMPPVSSMPSSGAVRAQPRPLRATWQRRWQPHQLLPRPVEAVHATVPALVAWRGVMYGLECV